MANSPSSMSQLRLLRRNWASFSLTPRRTGSACRRAKSLQNGIVRSDGRWATGVVDRHEIELWPKEMQGLRNSGNVLRQTLETVLSRIGRS